MKTRISQKYLISIDKGEFFRKYLKKEISRDELYSKIPQELLNKVITETISDDNLERIFSDIDTVLDNKPADIIIGGPPCQAYSLIGRARDPKGMKEDKRNYLYKSYLSFLERYNPSLFVFENVKGLLSVKAGELLKIMISEMNNIGYTVDYKILNASTFGVPQDRERMILIGWKSDLSAISYPIFEKTVFPNNTIENLFSDLPSLKAGEKIDYRTQHTKNILLEQLKIRTNESNYIIQHETRNHNSNDLEIYKFAVDSFKKGIRIKYTDIPHHLQTHKNIRSFLDRYKVVDPSSISHTMVAHISKDGHYYIHGDKKQNRSLSVREAARIQTFPDDYYFESTRTSAFQQIGNAVPPLMAEAIAMSLKQYFVPPMQ